MSQSMKNKEEKHELGAFPNGYAGVFVAFAQPLEAAGLVAT